ncbi:MAG: response regulator [Flavisolibacter sp.]
MNRKHTILVVDDDADDREIIKDAFMAAIEELEYVFLENGDKLLEYLDNNIEKDEPSLVLLDLNMPGKDGRESLKEIKCNKRFHHLPIIVFTTSSSQRDRLMAYDLGANCFITKPDTFNKLVEMAGCIGKLWLV